MMRPSAVPASPVVWDETPCPLCGRDDPQPELEAPDPTPAGGEPFWFAVVRCRQCGMRYTNPRPDSATIAHFYPPDYKPHRRPGQIRHARTKSLWAKLTGRGCPERDGVLPWSGPGRLLDFGCGGGNYLKRMADQGWQVTGLDSAVGAVQDVQAMGLPAMVGTLPHPELLPGTFDVITMWHSLEHVHDPRLVLAEAFDLLVPGGKLIVACPNIGGLPYRWFGANWFGLDLPRHLHHFTPATLSELLTACGFRTERVRGIRHSDWVRGSARLSVRRGRAMWLLPLLWKPFARALASAAYLFGRSDCMVTVASRP